MLPTQVGREKTHAGAKTASPPIDDARLRLRMIAPPIRLARQCFESRDLHGYGIMQEVAHQSEGKYRLGPGTLYDNLQKLVQHRLVEEADRRPADDDPRRRYYRLTSLGREVLKAETARLERIVREARLRLQLVKPRRA